MNPWIILFIVIIIIIIIVVVIIFFIRRPLNSLTYGQIIKIRNTMYENGFLSSCNIRDTDCSRRVYVPELLNNLRNSETQTWRIHSDTINDGQPVKYGDIIYLVPTFNVDLQLGLCNRISQQGNCRETIGLIPIETTGGTVRWQIKSNPSLSIPDGNPVLFNQELIFLNPTLNRTMAVCTAVSSNESCGGPNCRYVTLLTQAGIQDKWVILSQ